MKKQVPDELGKFSVEDDADVLLLGIEDDELDDDDVTTVILSFRQLRRFEFDA